MIICTRSRNMMSTLTRSLATFAEKEPNNVIVFSEQQLVGYSCSQMFKVVSDVDNYHNFVPYCRRSVVTLRKPQMLCANLNVGFHPFLNLSYTSHVTMVEPHLMSSLLFAKMSRCLITSKLCGNSLLPRTMIQKLASLISPFLSPSFLRVIQPLRKYFWIELCAKMWQHS